MTNTRLNVAALKACAVAASTEEARFYLRGVLVEATERAVIYVAMDGHMMLVYRDELPEGDPDNDVLGSWIIPSDVIARMKATKWNPPGSLRVGDAGTLVLTDCKEAGHLARPIDGTFPDWRRVIPGAIDNTKPVERARFDPALVGRLAKVANLLGMNNSVGVKIHTDGDNPAAITFGGEAPAFGVIMPCRQGSDLWAGAPDWAKRAAPESIAAE